MKNQNTDLSNGYRAFKKKNFVLAADIFSRIEKKEAVENKKITDDVIYYQAICFIRLGKYPPAIRCLEKLLKVTEKRFFILHANMLLGYIYCRLGKIDLAEKHLNLLLSNNAENSQVYALLGFIYQKRKDHAQAEYYYNKSLTLDPRNANSLNSMGYNYLLWGKEFPKALKYIEKAVEQDNTNPAYLDSLGWYFFIKKKFSKAFYYISKSLRFGYSVESKRHLEEVRKHI